jgi:hypothetical protein
MGERRECDDLEQLVEVLQALVLVEQQRLEVEQGILTLLQKQAQGPTFVKITLGQPVNQ